ncbi:MAG: hypothetical protein KatS3mg102_2267 [Planctomycetota bacterium]|nr:MAG: hypothetical protein KatS3mg102_2267 [Planctomycetota bacterium]
MAGAFGKVQTARRRVRRFDLEAAARGRKGGLMTLVRGRRLPLTLTAAAFLGLQCAVVPAGIAGLEPAQWLGIGALLLALTALLGWYMSLYERQVLADLRKLMLLEALTLLVLALAKIVLALGWSPYLVPFAAFAVAVSVGLGQRLAVVWSGMAVAALALMAGLHLSRQPVLHLPVAAALGAGGLVGIFSLDRVARRSKVVAAGLYVGLVQAALILVTEFALAPQFRFAELAGPGASQAWITVCFGLLNGLFCGYFLAEAGLRLVENAFDVVTDLRLQELANLNQPILKKFALEAPGTFHHSQMVGMLAEAAAEAIGANALLCRVGCHFHDLGKLAKPEYYVENLGGGVSKHTGLTPTMSTLIVISHVKDGIEMAKELGLPSKVIDFIAEHHGTIAVEYFYRQAVEQRGGDENAAGVNKDDFRYPGPRPRSRETAIVMIADAVEAISRVLDEPNPSRIDGMVHDVILKRLLEGQFDECGITMAELKQVKDAMVRVLLAAHHGRIKYPKPPADELRELGLSGEAASRIAGGGRLAGPQPEAAQPAAARRAGRGEPAQGGQARPALEP